MNNISLTQIKAVIFDLDGTLADTIDALGAAMNRVMRTFGYPECSREKLIQSVNYGAREFTRLCIPEGAELESAFQSFLENYAKTYTQTDKPFDGITPALKTLTERQYRLAMLSNKVERYTQELNKILFPAGLFKIVRGLSDLPAKPDPTSALDIAASFGVNPGEMALVGDSDIDMQTARAAGMVPVGVSWGYRSREVLLGAGAAVIIDTPEDITKIFP